MITEKCNCEVAIYFNKEPHALADFEFLIDRLLTREALWCAQLCNLKPYGLNKRCEFTEFQKKGFVAINTIQEPPAPFCWYVSLYFI